MSGEALSDRLRQGSGALAYRGELHCSQRRATDGKAGLCVEQGLRSITVFRQVTGSFTRRWAQNS